MQSIIQKASDDFLREHIAMWTKRIGEGRFKEEMCREHIKEAEDELASRETGVK